MTTYIDRTNNPLIIMAIIVAMLAQAVARFALTAAGHAARFAAAHYRIALLCLAPIAAIVAINLAWPLIVAVLGKLALGGGLTAGFAFVFRV